jgi:hypothetical protein
MFTEDDKNVFEAAIADLQHTTGLGNTKYAELLEQIAKQYREMAKVEGE